MKQQGFGRPIIAQENHGQRVVAVGPQLFRSAKWKSFHDFLFFYVKFILQGDWVAKEEKKDPAARHLLLQWMADVQRYLASWKNNPEGPPMTALPAAYLGLAYNLYLISHNNGKVHEHLLHRLKNADLFLGAYYEAFVTGAMILAGFDIELEDETDPSKSHCEFTATYRRTGQKYSVEAKMRRSKKTPPEIGDQLHKALKKEAQHPRIIFVELNVTVEPSEVEGLLTAVLANAHSREDEITIKGQPAPPAYLIVTNCPPASIETPHIFAGLVDGFRMADFRHGQSPGNLHQALEWRERHRGVLDLAESLTKHLHVPSTFDGELPQFAFTDASRERLIVGNRYTITTPQGDVTGELTSATVIPDQKTAMCCIRKDDGASVIVGSRLSDAEMEAYFTSPETFFGVITGPSGKVDHPFKFYDWIYESYRHNSKEHFLTHLLKDAPDLADLQNRSQEELAKIFAERTTNAMTLQAGWVTRLPTK